MQAWTLMLVAYWLVSAEELTVQIIENNQWNVYCNSLSYLRLSGNATAKVLISQTGTNLYGNCTLSFGRADGHQLYLYFTKYPAYHMCEAASLLIYEKVEEVNRVLLEGSCGDSPHFWRSRTLNSTTSDIWIQYSKTKEWPDTPIYSMMNFEMLISAKPINQTCDDLICRRKGECRMRSAAPPSVASFDEEKSIWQCLCLQPFQGLNCELLDPMWTACLSRPCLNGGSCSSVNVESYTCECIFPWIGDQCQYNSASCKNNPICGEHGTCTMSDDNIECVCDTNWSGVTCSNPSPCLSLPCAHDGSCTQTGEDNFTCTCTYPWQGLQCTELSTLAPNLVSEVGLPEESGDEGLTIAVSRNWREIVIALVAAIICLMIAILVVMFIKNKYSKAGSSKTKANDSLESQKEVNRTSPEIINSKSVNELKRNWSDMVTPVDQLKLQKDPNTELKRETGDHKKQRKQEKLPGNLQQTAAGRHYQCSPCQNISRTINTPIRDKHTILTHRQKLLEKEKKHQLGKTTDDVNQLLNLTNTLHTAPPISEHPEINVPYMNNIKQSNRLVEQLPNINNDISSKYTEDLDQVKQTSESSEIAKKIPKVELPKKQPGSVVTAGVTASAPGLIRYTSNKTRLQQAQHQNNQLMPRRKEKLSSQTKALPVNETTNPMDKNHKDSIEENYIDDLDMKARQKLIKQAILQRFFDRHSSRNLAEKPTLNDETKITTSQDNNELPIINL